MAFLQHSTLLSSIGHRTGSRSRIQASRGEQHSPTKVSVGSLVQLVRHPIETIGETVEGWRDGLTKEERARKQCLDDRKQVLNLRLRIVSYNDLAIGSSAVQLLTYFGLVGNELR